MTGPLALVGGDEFHPGNEPQDRLLVGAAGTGPAFVVPTAAARQNPGRAVETARDWFRGLGLALEVLPVLRPADAASPALAEKASMGSFFYLVGGDPGLVARVLAGSLVWRAIVAAWRQGAALAGSSAGAMAMCEWTLVRAGWPAHDRRRYQAALGLVPMTAVLPHFETFGSRWVPSAGEALPSPAARLLGLDERTAAVWQGSWRVLGAGKVTVISAGQELTFQSGSEVSGLLAPVWDPLQGAPGARQAGPE